MTPQRHAPAPVTVRPALLPHLCGVGHAREGSLMDAGRVMMPILLLLAGLLDGTVCHGQDDWPAAQECLKRMTVPPGFDVKLFAAEPDVVNPIAIDFDHRGRMYVLEALQYPVKAPEDKQGLDRIRILEDTDGDHTADRVTLFADRLNLGSGIAVGHGGVFVLQPPYLLFLQDSDGDDRADRREVLLDGWGYADTHATANSLIFGPDGWLYGNQGFGNQSMVRGKTFHAGFWRYHPQSKGFEVFAEGTSNTWGLDYDEHGNFFASVSVIPHLYHVVPRAFHRHPRGYLWSNPHAYGEIDTVADHRHFPPPGFEGDVNDARFGGGHAHTGCLIYQGGAFPRKYHGRVFLNNLHGNRINSDVLARRGSSFTASHGPDFFLANDNNFHGIQLRTAPDGSVFVLDWYDSQICHNSDPDVWDRDYGRIYKIVYRESKQFGRADLSELPTAELVKLLRHDNSWWWRRALLILDERADRSAVEALKELVRRSSDDRHALRALWALHNLESLDEHFLRKTLAHDSGPVRGWSVRFLSEVPATELGSETWKSLMHLVRREPSADVRLELAVATQRWGGEADVRSESLLKLLMQRDEDADDPAISAMLWLGWEPIVAAAPQRALQWLLAHEAAHPMVRNPILPWSLRRLVESDNPELIKLDPSERRRDLVSTALAEDLNLAVATLARLKDSSALPAVLEAILTGLAGRRLEAPAAWPAAATELAKSPDAEVGNLSRRLGVHFGDPQAVSTFEQQAIETSLPKSQRLQAIDMLALARHALSVDSLLRTVLEDESVDIRTHALNAVAAFDDTKIARTLLANWSRLSPQLQQQTIRTLTGRKRSAHDVLHAIEQGVMQRQSLSEADARRIAEFHDPELNDKLERVWGKLRVTTPETISRALAELRERLETSSGDRTAGEAIFWKNCANCHKLNGRGHNVGPELTGANRRDPEYLLVNIIDPNRSVERSYAAAVILDVSGKVHTGLLVQQTPDRITLNGERGVVTILERYEVEELKLSEKSLMPEGLANNLTPEQFGDLVAFLMEDLYLTKGLVSKRFPSSKPLDEKFAVESTPHPLRAAGAQWRPFHIGAAGRVEFDGRSSDRYRRPQEGCHYIYAEVAAHRDLDTEMVVGFETGLQIRVNDQVVYHQNSPAGYTPISRKSPIFIRSRIPETPVFEKMKATESFSKNPVG